LKAAIQRVATEPFDAAIAHAKLFAADRRFSEAHLALNQAVLAFPLSTMHHSRFRNILAAAILSHAPDLASQWLSRRFGARYDISFAVVHSSDPPHVAGFEVKGNAARFLFSHSVFDPAGEVVLQRWSDIFALFDIFMKSRFRTDGVVTVNLGDGGYSPGLAFSEHRPDYFLIPDAHYMDAERYEPFREALRAEPVAWHDRVPVAFWRGATTGIITEPSVGWRGLPRIRLCGIGRDRTDIIDAGITNVVQIDDPTATDWLRNHGLMRDSVSARSFQNYRYQIDIDGNTNSWAGLPMKLLSGSPVLKVASPTGHQQWYYDRLLPWINFVPVAADMADIVENVEWLRRNDDVARRIGDAGRELGEALTEERELWNAAPVIAAAIRTAARKPIIDLKFGMGHLGHGALRSGWVEAVHAARAADFEGKLELPKPEGFDDFVLSADVSVLGRSPQRVTVVANGAIIAQRSVEGRATIHCPLARTVATAGDKLAVSLHFPDHGICASRDAPLDASRRSLELHGLRLTAARCFTDGEASEAAEAAAQLADASSRPRALGVPAFPAGALSAVRTIHGTVMYIDVASGRLRHGSAGGVPRNLFLARDGNVAWFIRVAQDGSQCYIQLQPEEQTATASTEQYVGTFDVIDAGIPDRPALGLRARGLYVCAEPDGSVTLSRRELGVWERLGLSQDGVLTMGDCIVDHR
jgi:hypothetical protein